ncbi:MAG: GNAT family N-acetyltransferase [Hydrogenophaga sp.]|jgi:GNAT superfamily N-acetyltransferase|uniref:GNAT family N-acetyltransferase n=1 Tax=Hydrogenophaga sp. TaxID=1904254 RepID=UPI0027272AB8|nr:GNAT family N-acetyltransferase [Hydrogenophaga sp.]MDO9203465.1 GNAT family N-acetyltransferase [Hydrogenophaga sp.]MDO9479127.1 GNAT family N-acetyltransferase [Hydrogenophaga sp.]MDP1895946.1 GNAT family N-acetyltransferase [Hydrogenophaga sp.]MDP3343959.1 GNAT family N-acetyltransferase [Hydrogenophaga sp.]MDP3805068.1 GNAT family N-acetyltransferase [Hydrogenophaga sp.]
MSTTIKEGYVPGCIGRIVQLHANYYSVANGFGVAFEAKVARELAEFCQNYQSGRDGIWLVHRNGNIEGSVVIDGTHASTSGAHLRWFITTEAIRGQGLGTQLLAKAVEFVQVCSYRKTFLWTFSGLDAARHLYESHKFRLVHESPGNQWGSLVTEQRFERGEA